jgi:hypothetical protein
MRDSFYLEVECAIGEIVGSLGMGCGLERVMDKPELYFSESVKKYVIPEKSVCTNCSRVFLPHARKTVVYTQKPLSKKYEQCPLCQIRELYLLIETNAYMRKMNRRCTIHQLLRCFEVDFELHVQYFEENFTFDENKLVDRKVRVKDIFKWIEEGVLRIIRKKQTAMAREHRTLEEQEQKVQRASKKKEAKSGSRTVQRDRRQRRGRFRGSFFG